MSKSPPQAGRKPSRKIRRLLLVTILVGIFALGATAAVSIRAARKQPSTPPAPTAQTNNARSLSYKAAAPLDAQTAQVRPLTQEEAQRLAEGLKKLVNQSTDGLQQVQHADGSVSMDLQGRFQNVAVARRDEDGQLVQSCVDNPESAAAFFGIDPQLVGVKKNAGSVSVKTATPKGEDR